MLNKLELGDFNDIYMHAEIHFLNSKLQEFSQTQISL